jgi:hypothetical protein
MQAGGMARQPMRHEPAWDVGNGRGVEVRQDAHPRFGEGGGSPGNPPEALDSESSGSPDARSLEAWVRATVEVSGGLSY